MTKSNLVIGATGLSGLNCIQKLSEQDKGNEIHAFVRSADKLDDSIRQRLDSIQVGDARKPSSLRKALRKTNANWVVVTIGSGGDVSKSDIRTKSAQALVQVLVEPEFSAVRTVVVSSNGAGTSKIKVGFGIGMMIAHHLRHVMVDHSGQEEAFKAISHRTIVVRPTALTNGASTGKLVSFPDDKKSPTIKTDRADLAQWIVQAIGSNKRACTVNLTGVKSKKQ